MPTHNIGKNRLSPEYRRWVWQAWLRLEKTSQGKPRRGEVPLLLRETRISGHELEAIVKDGKAGRLGAFPPENPGGQEELFPPTAGQVS